MSLFGGLFGGSSNQSQINANAKKAQNAINSGAKKGYGFIDTGVNQAVPNYQQGVQAFAPYNATGATLNTLYGNAVGANGDAGNAAAVSAFHNSPGFNFALDQANNNVLRNAAATGGVASGGTLQALSDRAQGLQDQDYQNWLDNLYRGGTQGLQGATGQANELNNLGNLFNTQGENKANIATGAAANQASILNQQNQQLLANNSANNQNLASLLLGGAGLGSKLLGLF